MRKSNWYQGFFLVFAGATLLLYNFGHLAFDWSILWRYWPVLLILAGIYSIFRNPAIKFLLLIFTVLGLAWGGILFFDHREPEKAGMSDKQGRQHFFQQKDPDSKKALFSLEISGSELIIKDSTSSLIDVFTNSSLGNYFLERTKTDSLEYLKLSRSGKELRIDGNVDEELNIRINSQVNWSLNVKADAASVDLFVKNFRIDTLLLDMNAASLDLELGSFNAVSYVKIDADASKIHISYPEGIACEVQTDISLSAKSIPDLQQITENLYRTPEFQGASNKIFIKVNARVSDLRIESY